jgi:two-component system, OmpR family, response regulator QseB
MPYNGPGHLQREPGYRTAATRVILMVEDHAFFSAALDRVLGQRLYAGLLGPAIFHDATTVAEALKLVAEAGPFDLAVVDLMLPDGDGTDVVRAIKGRWPETPVCVLSAVTDLSGALAAGADEAIPKSTPLPEIVGILVRLATGGGRAEA